MLDDLRGNGVMADNTKVIIVGMADLNVVRNPGMLTTYGLGSCVGITLYDSVTKIAGMAHIMLPSSKIVKENTNVAKFADSAMVKLINDMIYMGAARNRLVAKIAGGAQMFAFSSTDKNMRIGDQNVNATIQLLKVLNIPILAQHTGENYGRTIEIYTEDGRLVVKTIGHGTYVL